jgi:hypothetical protein
MLSTGLHFASESTGPHRHQIESCGRFSGRSEFCLINSERRPAETPNTSPR